jgi:CRISPR-associated protein Cas1
VPYNQDREEKRMKRAAGGYKESAHELLSEAGELDQEGYDNANKRVIPIQDVDSLLLFGEVNFNSRMLQFLNSNNIPAHLFNYYGYYSGTYYPNEYLLSGFLLVDQVEHYKRKSDRLVIAQKFIEAASSNMLRNLKYYNGRAGDLSMDIQKIEDFRESIALTPNIHDLMGIEGNIRKSYYAAFPKILGDKFDFNKRVRNPPDNAVNALISFGNAMVYTACLTEIYKTQLSPLISYLHEPGERRFSLALDLAEIFKPLLADRVIFSCLNQEQIKAEDFDDQMNYCYLKEKGRKTFSKAFEQKMTTTITHRKLDRKVSYRRLIRLECYKLVKHLTNTEEYEPFKAWW